MDEVRLVIYIRARDLRLDESETRHLLIWAKGTMETVNSIICFMGEIFDGRVRLVICLLIGGYGGRRLRHLLIWELRWTEGDSVICLQAGPWTVRLVILLGPRQGYDGRLISSICLFGRRDSSSAYLGEVTVDKDSSSAYLGEVTVGESDSSSELEKNYWRKWSCQIIISVGVPTSSDAPHRLQAKNWAHFPENILATELKKHPTKRCRVCYKHKIRKETTCQCRQCQVPLHLPTCFEKHHTVQNY
ncbi:hypothetical protein AVEN_174440-1 [Araneus ventricosus]|uniref:Uncharacterized protein n=1 Tax=Araneus ventricosus TaxID=182803 RepID=A0A4Y2RHR6_ARAVE|nr:hypothetical protein AVEN_174440-1 [Araneus ventricosus]